MISKTFTTADGKQTFSAKAEFFEKCPDPHTKNAYELMTTYKLTQYIHNDQGPALVVHRPNGDITEYWLDGQQVEPEVAKRIEHNHQFGNKLSDIIEDTK